MGKLEEFEVQYENPMSVFFAGETLRGSVVVKLNEAMDMRKLYIWILARSKVHWTRTIHSGRSTHTLHYRAEEVFIDQRIILFGDDDGETRSHPEGSFVYPFEFPLAEDLPSSFEGAYGSVRFVGKAVIDKPWKFDHETKSLFTVISRLDLNQEPIDLMSPIEGGEFSPVSCCCWISGNVISKFQIDRLGFVPGESITVNAEVRNESNTVVSGTKVALKQYTEYFGSPDSLLGAGEMKGKCTSDLIAEINHGPVKQYETDTWKNVSLEIPPLPPSRLVGCNIINIQYVMEFHVSVNYGSDIRLATDITIGTIPLSSIWNQSQCTETGDALIRQPVTIFLPDKFASSLPAPTYEKYVKGTVDVSEENESQHVRGARQWAPAYPTYRKFNRQDGYYPEK